LLLHKLGDDPRQQETVRIWDSGVRLRPSGMTLYLGQLSTELLVQKMKIYSYWSTIPVTAPGIVSLEKALSGMEMRWGDPGMLLLRP